MFRILNDVPIVPAGISPTDIYRRFSSAGYQFNMTDMGDHVQVEVREPGQEYGWNEVGELYFARGELAKIEVSVPGIGLGTALVGSAMNFYRSDKWVFSTGFRDDNGRIFANHLALLLGERIGIGRHEGAAKYFTHALPMRFAVPRRTWVLVRQGNRTVEAVNYDSTGDSEAAAIARKLIRRAESNVSGLHVASLLFERLEKTINSARDYLVDPPVLRRGGKRLATLDLNGHAMSYSPIPAVTDTLALYQSVEAGDVPGVRVLQEHPRGSRSRSLLY